jgi:hypothetical protein
MSAIFPTPVSLPLRLAAATAVSANANASVAAQNLIGLPVPAGALNVLNSAFRVSGSGVINVRTTCTITIDIQLGGVTIISWTAAGTATNLNNEFSFDVTIGTNTVGATGKVFAHGTLNFKGTAGAGTATVAVDGNTAISGSIDLTSAQTLQARVTFSVNNGSGSNNDATQHEMLLN